MASLSLVQSQLYIKVALGLSCPLHCLKQSCCFNGPILLTVFSCHLGPAGWRFVQTETWWCPLGCCNCTTSTTAENGCDSLLTQHNLRPCLCFYWILGCVQWLSLLVCHLEKYRLIDLKPLFGVLWTVAPNPSCGCDHPWPIPWWGPQESSWWRLLIEPPSHGLPPLQAGCILAMNKEHAQ